MWRNAFGAYLDLHRPLCFGRGIPFVPLRDCGFIFTQDFPVEAEIGRYYETPDYISHSDTKKGAMNSVYHRVRSYMLKRKARLVAHEAHRKTGASAGYRYGYRLLCRYDEPCRLAGGSR